MVKTGMVVVVLLACSGTVVVRRAAWDAAGQSTDGPRLAARMRHSGAGATLRQVETQQQLQQQEAQAALGLGAPQNAPSAVPPPPAPPHPPSAGVTWHAGARKWEAVDGKRHHLGYFAHMGEAAAARKASDLLAQAKSEALLLKSEPGVHESLAPEHCTDKDFPVDLSGVVVGAHSLACMQRCTC